MRIYTNVAAINAHRNLFLNDVAMGKTMEKLSSGLRVNRAADDAAGLAISEKMRAQINGYNQALRNAQDGVSLLQTAEGAMTEIHSMLQRMVTLATQSANGTYDNSTDRNALQAEVNQLIQQIDQIAGSTNFNGINLLNSTASIQLQIGANVADTLTFSLANATSTALGINSLSISTQSAANAAITTLRNAINLVSSARARFGAVQNRLEHTINNLGVTAENLSASESRIRDADMAYEMTQFIRNQILVQAGTAMLAQANAVPQNVLRLLG